MRVRVRVRVCLVHVVAIVDAVGELLREEAVARRPLAALHLATQPLYPPHHLRLG